MTTSTSASLWNPDPSRSKSKSLLYVFSSLFLGNDCTTIVDYCDSSPCLNGGTCFSKTGSYECHCKTGFYGTYCQKKTNECDSNPRENNGQCVKIDEGYRCKCPPGESSHEIWFYVKQVFGLRRFTAFWKCFFIMLRGPYC